MICKGRPQFAGGFCMDYGLIKREGKTTINSAM